MIDCSSEVAVKIGSYTALKYRMLLAARKMIVTSASSRDKAWTGAQWLLIPPLEYKEELH